MNLKDGGLVTAKGWIVGVVVGLACSFASAEAFAQARWSDPSTWGGRVPRAGEHVTIPGGQRIVLDVTPPPLASLTINGALTFGDTDLNLTVGWVMVHGLFEIGTEAVAWPHHAVITLTGRLDEDVMGMGARFIGAMDGGQIEIHGARRTSVDWTVLEADAHPGDTAITVTNIEHAKQGSPLDWRPGDLLAIAASGRDPLQAEAVTVTVVEDNRVSFTPGLQFHHLGGLRTIEGREVDMRAEVGLLTRNIVIQGAPDGWSRNLGGHVMSMAGTVMKIEGTELRYMGQAGRKGRYPIHWHFAGDVLLIDYARFNSIWTSFHRAIAIHQTRRVEMRGNVAANINSHTFVVAEDGNEEGSVVEDNVGILTRRLPDANFAFLRQEQPGSDGVGGQDEWRPATFWINNPRNTIRYNRAAGGVDAVGYFFDDPHGRMGASPVYPPEQYPEIFSDNVAHSYLATNPNDRDPARTSGHGLLVQMPDRPGGTSFDRFTAYQNSVSGAWLENAGERLQQPTLADNASGAILFRATVSDGFIIGASGAAISAHPVATRRGGVQVIGVYGGGKAPRVQRTTFVREQPAAVVVDSDHLQAGNVFEDIAFIETPIPVSLRDRSFEHTWQGALFDADGSLTGTGAATAVTGAPLNAGSEFRPGWGTYAPGGAFTTPWSPGATDRPSDLTSWVEGSTVGLSWAAPALGGITGYVIEAGSAPGAADLLVAPLGPATTQQFPGIGRGTYYARVRAQTASGLTETSNEVRVVVGHPACMVPEAPAEPVATVGGGIVSLTWLPGADSDVFGLLVGSVPGASDILAVPVGGVPSLVTRAPAGTYYVRVLAANSCGIGAPSGEITVIVQ